MSGKYALWLNYDNDKQKYQIPVNPEEIMFKTEGKVSTSEIDKIGTLLHKGPRGPLVVSWSGFFPAKFESYCSCARKDFKSPSKMHTWILKLMKADAPVHLVMSGGPFGLNIYAVITSYSATEVGGDPGTIQYSIELKEYRSVKVKKYTKGKKSGTNTDSKKRVSNKQNPQTYTIKSGDCLWNLAKKYYGSGARYTKILEANRSELDNAAKKYGYSNCRNGNLIFPGTKIKIP